MSFGATEDSKTAMCMCTVPQENKTELKEGTLREKNAMAGFTAYWFCVPRPGKPEAKMQRHLKWLEMVV